MESKILMDLTAFIVCPECHGKLEVLQDHWDCSSCKNSYPVVSDIVDLRTPTTHTEPNIDEAIERFEELSFSELTELLLKYYRLPGRIKSKIRDYYNNQDIRTEKMTKMFINNADVKKWEVALDFGCGSGASLNVLSRHFKHVIGVDASIGQLLLAKKSLQKKAPYHLFCAYGEKLPFQDNSLDYIQALNVIEHLEDVTKVMQEIKRCLVENGIFTGDSRNRYDLFAPEPHSGIRFLGFLPRSLIPRYVNWRCDADYESTYLLSWWELRRYLRKVFKPDEIKITVPDISAYGYDGRLLNIFNKVKNLVLLREFLLYFFIAHQITISKKYPFPEKQL